MVIWNSTDRTGNKGQSAISRYGEPRGAGAGGARVQDAMPAGLPRVPPRIDESVLEEGP